ncbi:hypothetical protein [Heyndrickxia acidiproducens]|uniref:hypothetical protein n=1 Tax=Heyndrickxia acidiproducens TaxID=1121084 RepID=UPI0003766834|nr:hypothetical protein [Heyndrickxia acidiproducens]
MNQALVIGAHQFAGFELCKALLNQGCSVVAVDEETEEIMVHTEKWMEVGRNANLVYQQAALFTDREAFTCFLPVYDYYIQRDKEKLERMASFLNQIAGQVEKHILIFPAHILTDQERESWIPPLQFKESLCFEFYVPTLYGPYQPRQLAFHQIISGSTRPDLTYEDRDALFISDAAEAVVQTVEKGQTGGKYFLQSREGNTWEEIARYLNEELFKTIPLPEQHTVDQKDLDAITVSPSLSYQEAIMMQIRQMRSSLPD